MRALSALLVLAVLSAVLTPSPAHAAGLTSAMSNARAVAAAKLLLTDSTTPLDRYPFYTIGPNAWGFGRTTGWVNGFLPGSLWLEHQLTGDAALRDSALARQATFANQASATNNHDIGFMFMASYGNAYRLTGEPEFRDTVLTAASSLSQRYNARIGMVRTTNTAADFWVYNDTMMNLELLYWGARNGAPRAWSQMATSHALRTAEDFFRADGGTYHYVAYREDTGAVIDKGQGQGYAKHTTWSRGHAWVIHGMAIAYRESGDVRLLEAARRATEYWVENLPADFVPYWDFDAPSIPDEPRDSSAASIAASAFIELAQLDPDRTWRDTYGALASSTLESLSSAAYLAQDDPLPAVLKHGTYAAMIGAADHGTSWGDYYFRQALMRYGTAVVRVGGPDRYHTSSRTSSSEFDSAQTAVIASGESFPDALSASGLAGVFEAPVLLVEPGRLPESVRREAERLGVRSAVIVGGVDAVSDEVVAALLRIPGVAVSRLGGRDRFATAANVAARIVAESPPGSRTELVFVARSDDFADSMSAGPLAYAQAAPILLTVSDSLHPRTAALLRDLAPERVIVLGGERSISPATFDAITAIAPGAQRIGGVDRYDTSRLFAQWALSQELSTAEHIGIVSGAAFPDALGGSAAVGSRAGVTLLTTPGRLQPTVAEWLTHQADHTTSVAIFGGESAVSGRAENDVRSCLPEQAATR